MIEAPPASVASFSLEHALIFVAMAMCRYISNQYFLVEKVRG
jgi:hypothetical protein